VLHLPGWKSPIRAVFFDAVGTLIHPEPPAPVAYYHVGQRFGSKLDPKTIAERFWRAFQEQEELDRSRGGRTDEERERQRWQATVGAVLNDVSDADACFRELFAHFARPSVWRVAEDVPAVLEGLARRGCVLGICSNFDRRLREVVAGLPELAPLSHLVISSEIGWKKPAPEFFRVLSEVTELPPQEILVVGDDPVNDVEGARAAGLAALLYDPRNRQPDRQRITRLADLLALG
jgi:putative hydrolase of the HAD superfamily